MKKDSYTIHVSVEQKHIDDGERKSWDKDPLALAINECLKTEFRGNIGKERRSVISIEWHDEFKRQLCQYMVRMDLKSIEFVNKFDNGEKVDPFVFVLTNVPIRMIRWIDENVG